MSLVFYRIGNWLHLRSIPVIPRICTVVGRLVLGAYIPSSASLGKRVKIAYGGSGLVIHPRAVIGDDCLLSPGVVIGGRGGHTEVPILEAGVQVFPGAKILGPIRVGEGSQIGVNAVVVKDLPSRSRVVAPASRVLDPLV